MALFKFVNLFNMYFPRTPKNLVLPAHEIGQLLRFSQILTKGWLSTTILWQPPR